MSLAQNYSEEIVQGGDSLVLIANSSSVRAASTGKPGAPASEPSSLIQVQSDLRIKDEDDDDEELLRANTLRRNKELRRRQVGHV